MLLLRAIYVSEDVVDKLHYGQWQTVVQKMNLIKSSETNGIIFVQSYM